LLLRSDDFTMQCIKSALNDEAKNFPTTKNRPQFALKGRFF
jgi:hypothetical protein